MQNAYLKKIYIFQKIIWIFQRASPTTRGRKSYNAGTQVLQRGKKGFANTINEQLLLLESFDIKIRWSYINGSGLDCQSSLHS